MSANSPSRRLVGYVFLLAAKTAPLMEAACRGHARGKFFERAPEKSAASARLRLPKTWRAPFLPIQNLKTRLAQERAKLSLKNPDSEAMDYNLKLAGRAASRRVAVGRHNWTFTTQTASANGPLPSTPPFCSADARWREWMRSGAGVPSSFSRGDPRQ